MSTDEVAAIVIDNGYDDHSWQLNENAKAIIQFRNVQSWLCWR